MARLLDLWSSVFCEELRKSTVKKIRYLLDCIYLNYNKTPDKNNTYLLMV